VATATTAVRLEIGVINASIGQACPGQLRWRKCGNPQISAINIGRIENRCWHLDQQAVSRLGGALENKTTAQWPSHYTLLQSHRRDAYMSTSSELHAPSMARGSCLHSPNRLLAVSLMLLQIMQRWPPTPHFEIGPCFRELHSNAVAPIARSPMKSSPRCNHIDFRSTQGSINRREIMPPLLRVQPSVFAVLLRAMQP
jgi:hypothetical protein